MKKNKIWVWKALDHSTRRVIAWELGGRDDETCQRLLEKACQRLLKK